MSKISFKHNGTALEGYIVGSLRDGRHWVRVEGCPLTSLWFGGKFYKFDYTDYPVSYSEMEIVNE